MNQSAKKQLVAEAKEIARQVDSWISLSNALSDPQEGLIARYFPTSAPSSLDFGVESLQFHAGVFDTELPVDASLFCVRFFGPRCDFFLQFKLFTALGFFELGSKLCVFADT